MLRQDLILARILGWKGPQRKDRGADKAIETGLYRDQLDGILVKAFFEGADHHGHYNEDTKEGDGAEEEDVVS